MKKKFILMLAIIITLSFFILNSLFGWFGYEKWKYRRCTFGNKSVAIENNTHIKDLTYASTIDLKGFKIYIEKGFWYGYMSMNEIRFLENTKYPYQVSFNGIDTINNVMLSVSNERLFDSVENKPFEKPVIYLKEPVLKDTLVLKISRYHVAKDSLGYIKVW